MTLLSFRDRVESVFDIADPTIADGWEPSAAELAAVRALEDEPDINAGIADAAADSSYDLPPGAYAALVFEFI